MFQQNKHIRYVKGFMKSACFSFLLLVSIGSACQKPVADSIRRLLLQNCPDTSRVLLLVKLSTSYLFFQPDSAVILSQKIIQQARKLDFAMGEGRALNVLGSVLRLRGDLPQALEAHFEALRISRTIRDRESEASSLVFIGVVYMQLSDYRQGIFYQQQARQIRERLPSFNILAISNIGDAYQSMNQMDSAMFYHQQAYALSKALPRGTVGSVVLTRLGNLQNRLGNNREALQDYQKALDNANITGDMLNRGRVQYRMAELYFKIHQPDSSLYYARQSFETSRRVSQEIILLSATNLMVKLYQANGNMDSAFHYLQLAAIANDSLFGPEKFQRLQLLTLAEQQRQQQLLQEQAHSQSHFLRIGLLSALAVFLLIAFLLWRNARQQKRANRVLNMKNSQIEIQRGTLETTLSDLRNTQTELIEKEKMASLYQQQYKIQQVRNKIASELHDDIGATLSSIHLFSEVAKKEINRDSLNALPMLEKIDNSSREMMQSMNEIVWSIQSKNDDTANLVDKIQSFASQLLSARNIAFRFDYPAHFLTLPIAMEVRRNIYLIFKETLNNISKHSQATEVDMEVELIEKNIHISIRDNGRGFDMENPSPGNGLLNLHDRSREISGQLHIDSTPGRGTRVDLECILT